MLSVGDDGKRMGYDAAMELQTQIDELKAKVSQLEALLDGGNPRFDTITCKGWRVVDEESKVRIAAASVLDGFVGVVWLVKDKARIMVGTSAHGNADVGLLDKDGKRRINATTSPDGQAGVGWLDKDGRLRINAATLADGEANMQWQDEDGKIRIAAFTLADGEAGVRWYSKDAKRRITAVTNADGTVSLPTKDLK